MVLRKKASHSKAFSLKSFLKATLNVTKLSRENSIAALHFSNHHKNGYHKFSSHSVLSSRKKERLTSSLVSSGHMIHDDVDKDVDADGLAPLNHVHEIVPVAASRVKAVGDRLVSSPPLGA